MSLSLHDVSILFCLVASLILLFIAAIPNPPSRFSLGWLGVFAFVLAVLIERF